MSHVVEQAVRPLSAPANTTLRRILRLCVPDEWYRRSKSRSLSLTPIESGGTLLETPSQSPSEDEEKGGTAKQRPKVVDSISRSEKQQASQPSRFSLFEGWGSVSSPTGSTTLSSALPGDRSSISVSAPMVTLQAQRTGLGIGLEEEAQMTEDDIASEFESMMVGTCVNDIHPD